MSGVARRFTLRIERLSLLPGELCRRSTEGKPMKSAQAQKLLLHHLLRNQTISACCLYNNIYERENAVNAGVSRWLVKSSRVANSSDSS